MLKQLTKQFTKKRQGKVNPQLKELNTLIWDYLGIKEDIINYVHQHKENKIMVLFVEDSIIECETKYGIGTVNGSIEEKIHNHQQAIQKLKTVKQFMEMYS